jgi:segregation and condensation protein B
MMDIDRYTETLIFCAQVPISIEEIKNSLAEFLEREVSMVEMEAVLERLMQKYQTNDFSFQIVKSGGGFQFLTKPDYQSIIQIWLKQKSKKRLSNASLETVAIIAYKQPITKTQIEQIRGVNSDYAIQKLLEKELIEIKGKSDAVGRPILYGTTTKFMDYFGINHLKELPTLKDFNHEENIIGEEKS